MKTNTPNQENLTELNNDDTQNSLKKIQERTFASLLEIKKGMDNQSNPMSWIRFLDYVEDIYKTNVIYPLKHAYIQNPSKRDIYSARANKMHCMFDGIYQEGIKKVKGLDLRPCKELFRLPTSLEKLTFPEDN